MFNKQLVNEDKEKMHVKIVAKASKKLQAEIEEELKEDEDTNRDESGRSDANNTPRSGENSTEI